MGFMYGRRCRGAARAGDDGEHLVARTDQADTGSGVAFLGPALAAIDSGRIKTPDWPSRPFPARARILIHRYMS